MSPAPAELLDDTEARSARDAAVRGLAAFASELAERVPSREELALASSGARRAVLRGGGAAREATVRLIHREARKILDDLAVVEAIQGVLADYSLEISASLSLKPLAPEPG